MQALCGDTLGGLLDEARRRLSRAGAQEPALDARLLVEHFTATTRAQAVASPRLPVPADAAGAVRAALARREGGEPVHRILGYREFYGLRLRLSPETLEPRPDTETLVDLALPFVRRVTGQEGGCRILDLGTGTGAIALALLAEVADATAVGVDISQEALAMAAANADMNGLGERFETCRSDWYQKVAGRFHLIVSNPPYITTTIWKGLERNVRDFDPRQALDGGEDGLDAYREIVAGAAGHLAEDGMIAVECGYGQACAVTRLFMAGGFEPAGVRKDLAGRERALGFVARKSTGSA